VPRTYSFDHFTVPKSKAPTGQQPKPNSGSAPNQGVHYGRSFAQTFELYQAHGMEKELEKVIRSDKRKAAAKKTVRRKAAAKRTTTPKRASSKRRTAARKSASRRRRK
jgi:hypothetical protein